jgi:hypothetical protein
MDRCGKSRPAGIRSPDLPARSESLYRLRYPGSKNNIILMSNTMSQYRDEVQQFCRTDSETVRTDVTMTTFLLIWKKKTI